MEPSLRSLHLAQKRDTDFVQGASLVIYPSNTSEIRNYQREVVLLRHTHAITHAEVQTTVGEEARSEPSQQAFPLESRASVSRCKERAICETSLRSYHSVCERCVPLQASRRAFCAVQAVHIMLHKGRYGSQCVSNTEAREKGNHCLEISGSPGDGTRENSSYRRPGRTKGHETVLRVLYGNHQEQEYAGGLLPRCF